MNRYPMQMVPVGKDYLWGGNRLKQEYGKKIDLTPLAESWELSCHPDGESFIANGELAGTSLRSYLARDWKGLLGSRAGEFSDFPILFKLIDAAQPLSVQVHPSDEYALREEGGYGKTEMWVVLQAEPDAELFFGLSRAASKEELAERIAQNTLTEVLRRVRVQPGDMVFVEPGTLHAIGAGIVIAEIQQNSNLTYRVFDYGRVGADGKTRPLHVQKALDVSKLELCSAPVVHAFDSTAENGADRVLASCPYFTVRSLCLHGQTPLTIGNESFLGLFCAQGACELVYGGQSYPLEMGSTYFLPAGLGGTLLRGDATLLTMEV